MVKIPGDYMITRHTGDLISYLPYGSIQRNRIKTGNSSDNRNYHGNYKKLLTIQCKIALTIPCKKLLTGRCKNLLT